MLFVNIIEITIITNIERKIIMYKKTLITIITFLLIGSITLTGCDIKTNSKDISIDDNTIEIKDRNKSDDKVSVNSNQPENNNNNTQTQNTDDSQNTKTESPSDNNNNLVTINNDILQELTPVKTIGSRGNLLDVINTDHIKDSTLKTLADNTKITIRYQYESLDSKDITEVFEVKLYLKELKNYYHVPEIQLLKGTKYRRLLWINGELQEPLIIEDYSIR